MGVSVRHGMSILRVPRQLSGSQNLSNAADIDVRIVPCTLKWTLLQAVHSSPFLVLLESPS